MPVTARQAGYLDALGIDRYQPRVVVPHPAAQPQSPVTAKSAPHSDPAGAWRVLAAEVAGCTACALSGTRTQTVFGVGQQDADWLIVGEAPGAEEDACGEPFVGRAGKLLDSMLLAVGLDRRRGAYISNIVKCRPPKNRDPAPAEAAACMGYLERQIALLQPELILAVGRVAAQHLLGSEEPVGRLRGRVWHWRDTGIPLVVTYHPAYLLRSPLEKRKSWDDLCLAQEAYRQRKGPSA
ncbi:uracil-DNA glycosylase family protein [Immundisolibacter sp.]|uniref:uracil-DNA glycosylase n=1 Tax=Immundisolibacter sp. TaxID=1934948 RepID=UPI003566181C